ncbi:phospholipase D-like domain-containing protein [Telmatospirillum sp.]|uniref:phospholipase D-like domain-containing protein n=1 Tax=Telmatospirillum sp. TaxID=2079197 RepID=UPI00283AE1E9|nr:phospholipase D-like domain-containing protein [Telmatospirillum sp.]MDR3436292.1 phospholipase D-like domain-containing protein [Telmatospirillum sp.]
MNTAKGRLTGGRHDMERETKAATGTPLEALAVQTFSRVTDARRTEGNAVRLLCDGAENYPAWLAAIAEARMNVHLESYFIEEGEVGDSFADALIAAARRGVQVRVLYDWLGCKLRTSRRFWERLRDKGIEVRSYNPPGIDSPLGWISRDHRKLLCIDGQRAFAGGLCIGHDWLGNQPRHIPPWRDTAVEIRGPAVVQLEDSFADSWAAAGQPLPALSSLPEARPADEQAVAGTLAMWVIAGKPGSMGLYRLEQLVAEFAEKSLWLTDAYFVATTAYVRALCRAARDGVDVRLLVPGASNLPAVQTLSRVGYRPLLAAGVRVFEWNGSMMHAKTAVADSCWSRIGSSNSNISSWIANRELDLVIHDQDLAKQMEEMYERDLMNATEMILDTGGVHLSGLANPGRDHRGTRTASTGRLIAGTVGFASAVGATISQQRAIAPVEAHVLGVAGVILFGLAVAGVLVPGLLAYPLALLGGWVGLTLVIRARKLHLSYRAPKAQERR